ncbi:hypothetical protein BC777_1091 [Yoonia maricola]|uniref:Uncharacterized protein n=1 Tax=Yoonia maricola TaxID=420999 RepID=A0A2M8WN09_9RHOB|nr:hypothetical protein [Yoonia maricola]PJI92246.1 hypothetical protein BC777_1091 [Yoonia maricola]
MPLQNRVQPTGDIISHPSRGLFTGNRGILHKSDGTLGTRRWAHKHWLICTLKHPKGRYHGPLPERGWSPLFFLDEAVALSAGHRPCHYCRRSAYHAYRDAWGAAAGQVPDRMAMDNALHQARVTRKRAQIRYQAAAANLPNGIFGLVDELPCLLWDDQALPYTPDGYGAPQARPEGMLTVLTPEPSMRVLAAGYLAVLHPSAGLSA